MSWNVTKAKGLGRFTLQLNPRILELVHLLALSLDVRQSDVIAAIFNRGSIQLIQDITDDIPERLLKEYQEWAEKGGD